MVNAYLRPIMQRYLQTLATELHGARLSVMRSNGGVMSAARAHQEAVHTVLSGPAGGVVGAFQVAREAGYRSKVAVSSFDTSIDCVGACVGVRSSRIKSIVDELAGERIDEEQAALALSHCWADPRTGDAH